MGCWRLLLLPGLAGLTSSEVFLVLCPALMVELGSLCVIHPAATQLTPIHGVGFPVLQSRAQWGRNTQALVAG